MEFRLHPRRLVDRLRHPCRIRLLFCRARLRYRRLRADAGALLRPHGAQVRAMARSRSTEPWPSRRASTASESSREVPPILLCCGPSFPVSRSRHRKNFRERLCCGMHSIPATPKSLPSVRGAIGVLAERGMTIVEQSGFPEEADRHALTVLQAEPPANTAGVSMIQPPTSRCASVSARDLVFQIKISPRLWSREMRFAINLSCPLSARTASPLCR